MPQQKEVAGVWYRNQEGKQFLKIALPADAWSMTATVKTKKGVHKISLDRWGDSTHKMSAYNSCHKPSFRDERQIERMEAETMVLYPAPVPNPVLPERIPGFLGGRGMLPRGNGGIRGLNWRAEGLQNPHPWDVHCTRMCRASGSSLLQEAERSNSICIKKEVQQKKETSQ